MPLDPLAAELKSLRDRIYSLERRGMYPPAVADASWNVIGAAGQPAFQNSWVNYDATWPTAAYRVDSEGWLIMRGLIRSGTLNSVAFTLPVAYRPAIMQVIRTNAADSGAYIQIGTDGQVYVASASNAYVSLAHVQIPLWNTDSLRLTKLNLTFYVNEANNRHQRLYLRRSGMWEWTGIAAALTAGSNFSLSGVGPDFSDIYWTAGTPTSAGRIDIGLNSLTVNTASTTFSIMGGIRWPDTSIEPLYTTLTTANSWVYFGITGNQWATPGYYKDSNGYVHLRGVIKDGSSATAQIATMPAGFRPGGRSMFATYGASGVVGIEVNASGQVLPRNATTRTYLSLAGISYLAEN